MTRTAPPRPARSAAQALRVMAQSMCDGVTRRDDEPCGNCIKVASMILVKVCEALPPAEPILPERLAEEFSRAALNA